MEVMATLNRAAAEAMVETGVHAATDVTGFGVIGHAAGMADGANATLRIEARALPRIVRFAADVSEADRLLVGDPQTSGGLLIAVAPERLETLLSALSRRGVTTRAVVGEVLVRGEGPVEVV